MLACMEVESACKSVLLANNYSGPRGKQMNTKDYVCLLEPLRLNEWELSLAMHPEFPTFRPFGGWTSAHPTESLQWYEHYNAVKHGREAEFHQATLESMVYALGAVFVVASAQFGPWLRTIEDHTDERGIPVGRTPWMDDLALVARATWASDFAVRASPEWPLEDTYIPPSCAPGFIWTAKAYWP